MEKVSIEEQETVCHPKMFVILQPLNFEGLSQYESMTTNILMEYILSM